jgi:hypothetical protein
VKFDVDMLLTVPDAPPEAGPDRALDPPLPVCPAVGEEEAVAVPLLLLPQAARIAGATSKSKVTLTNILSDSDVRIDIFFPSFSVHKMNIPDFVVFSLHHHTSRSKCSARTFVIRWQICYHKG